MIALFMTDLVCHSSGIWLDSSDYFFFFFYGESRVSSEVTEVHLFHA